jgi:hypothetical protein
MLSIGSLPPPASAFLLNMVSVQFCQPVGMAAHKPIRKQWQIFPLNIDRKEKKVPSGRTPAPGCPAVTSPCGAACDVDVVVTGKFLTGCNATAGYNGAGIRFVPYVCIWITAVINMPIGEAYENDLAVRIIAMIVPFAEFFT